MAQVYNYCTIVEYTSNAALVNKLVPSAWRSNYALDLRSLVLQIQLRYGCAYSDVHTLISLVEAPSL